MKNIEPERPFQSAFLHAFTLARYQLPLHDTTIQALDTELLSAEQFLIDPDVQDTLTQENEFLTSYAISKAEQSALTIAEAKAVYVTVLSPPEYDFLAEKLRDGVVLTRKEYEHLEFFNIAHTLHTLNQRSISVKDLTIGFLCEIHGLSTRGMDIFAEHLRPFTTYHSGCLRKTDDIRIGTYIPASAEDIPVLIEELIEWLQRSFTITNIHAFHAALYAVHPFHNGNKRVCRILEHVLLRCAGFNQKNLYSPSSYYHREKERYYKYLLHSIEKKNLTYFTSFAIEALVLAMLGVLIASIRAKRLAYLEQSSSDSLTRKILHPLTEQRELRFKELHRRARGKAARQTIVNHLHHAVKHGFLERRASGRNVFYRLHTRAPEEEIVHAWFEKITEKLPYIPDDIRRAA